jgi:probable O-glycosylation ligase (exosortase A-associated)
MAEAQRTVITSKTLIYAAVVVASIISPFFLITNFYYVPFIAIAAIGFAGLIFYSPMLGLYIYTAFLLIRPQEWLGVLSAIPVPMERPIAILLLISVLLHKHVRHSIKLNWNSIDKTLIVYMAMIAFTVVFSINVDKSWVQYQDALKLALLHFIVGAVIEDRKQLRWYLVWIIALTIFYSTYSVYGYYTGHRQYRMGIWRALGPDTSYGAPNSLAATLICSLPFLYYFYGKELRALYRWALVGGMAIMLWNLILTGSRTGMAATLVFFFLLMWQSKHKTRNFIVSSVLLVCIWFIMPQQYQERFLSTNELTPVEDHTGASASAASRIVGMKLGLKMLATRPLTGYGLGNFGYVAGTYFDPTWWIPAHSLIGQLCGEVGLIGIVGFLGWLGLMFYHLARLRRKYESRGDLLVSKLALSLKTQLLILLVLGLGGHNLFRYSWFVISALTVCLLKIERNDAAEGHIQQRVDEAISLDRTSGSIPTSV